MIDKEKVKCDICGKLFSSRKQLQQHKESLHAPESKILKRQESSFKFQIYD